MAKKSLIAREKSREKLVKRHAEKRIKLRAAMKDAFADFDDRLDAQMQLQKLPRNTSPSRLRRRCRMCGRPRGVYRKFGLCRIHLREALMRGDVTGGRKSSW